MAITPEESELIKKQLLAQVDKLPQENKEEIKEYIKNLNEEQLEEFLKQNQIQMQSSSSSPDDRSSPPQSLPSQCIFCAIAKNQVPSYKLSENKKSMAILELNPLSKAHSIVIPLEHLAVEKLPKPAMSLAQKLTKKIKKKFKPNDIKIETSNFQGHAMINVIPIYKGIPLKKQKADENELKKIQEKLQIKSRAKRTESKKSHKEKESKLPVIRMKIP
ncbi:MAG: HIT domain-containing protein [Candidatus Nanoarchaeia archaeon]|nr:HIT domain-containing protein [Candidatus Nanoarchaeia archaeon]